MHSIDLLQHIPVAVKHLTFFCLFFCNEFDFSPQTDLQRLALGPQKVQVTVNVFVQKTQLLSN